LVVFIHRLIKAGLKVHKREVGTGKMKCEKKNEKNESVKVRIREIG